MRHPHATAVGAFTLATLAALAAPAPAAGADDATVTVLHGVPGLTVDVYVGGEEVLPDFTPGTHSDPLTLPAGSFDVQVFADGDGPGNGRPAIEASGVQVPGGADATVVAHLDSGGQPELTVFVNDTTPTAPGQARLTVRHTAAAPAVDVRAGGKVLFGDLANPDEASADVPAGTYSADVVLAGTGNVALGPADLDLAEGTSTIVYAWGSAQDDDLDLAVQTLDGLHSTPGVAGGAAGLAPEEAGAPAWAYGLGALSLLALVVAGRRLLADVKP